ncbi:MAG: ABC transporter ATP-binding protein [Rhodobacteraceae bacterium]|nr:ABC transporter ATP-binding protein [Paracoccaceae bacterium]
MSDPVLVLDNATKRRGSATVLSEISLDLTAGTRLALLGHNGAGKSTLIKAVLGLTRLDAGRITVCGAAPGSAAARADVAYLPEAVAFHGALTGREQLAFFARLAGEAPKRCGTLLDQVGLAAAADRRIATYSKGMRQRLGLAQALLGRPRLVLLDEPTSGLDPVSRFDLYRIIDGMAAAGAAVLIASHALTEVEARTDRIAILRDGRLVADDTLAALTRAAALPIRLRIRARAGAAERVAEALGGTRVNGASVELCCPADEKMAALARITGLGVAVEDLEVTPPGLEDLYRYYSKEAV